MFLICFVSNNYGIYFVNIPKFVTNKRFMLDEEVPAKYASKFTIPTYVVYFHWRQSALNSAGALQGKVV